ncbi:hypothetical protein [Sporomusa acidovorans]|uniref:Uncharacterized protein n=1 Tax=Sporomusa acidovorans (strain ATCC 49682 / DSM 3132 / Mol) TaxID=1123286 RepID=A0ABZ3IW29_SPOA4|nr:hypothetical protein [Sporomusa acidovorans]OZC15269.1 hypothetical protein SPACI_50070 [Sporomusa acidovorans DSM 3132]SDE91679.1 hypothetical protein SAMN04488499_102642 [Sporomusa acidovorans]
MATNTTSIINTILSDITAVIPSFTSLVSSYRLLVGAAEEIQRTPDVPFEIFERAVIRYDRAGTLIDILLELLCCKIAFSSQFLAVTCAPVDIIRLLTSCTELGDDPCLTAEQILILEIIRQALGCNCHNSCFGPPPEGITPTKPPTPPAAPTPPATPAPATQSDFIPSDLETTQELTTEITPPVTGPVFRYTGPLSRRHI